ncbi:MAG: hypothetical protein KA035_00160 [Candidatus Levybacteria bacterium]|nr:hypothetical protein [Candidatus Levybacteria bacterium]
MGIFGAIGAAIGRMGGGAGKAIGGSFEGMAEAVPKTAEVLVKPVPLVESVKPSSQVQGFVGGVEKIGRSNPREGLEQLANSSEVEEKEEEPQEDLSRREFDFGGPSEQVPDVGGKPMEASKPSSEGDGIDQLVTLIAPAERIMEEATGANKPRS